MGIALFDAHCDTISLVQSKGGSIRENAYHTDLKRGLRFSPYAQIFAVFTRPLGTDISNGNYDADLPIEELSELGEGLLELLLSEFETNKDMLILCRDIDDAREAALKGKAAAFIAVEGSELLGCNPDRLEHFYKKGVRSINLCWNYDNAVCGAANGLVGAGLTQVGREYVLKMQELGIAVDLSHASEQTFWDTAEIAKRPLIAGHSNSKTLCDNPRNLTDAQFSELVRQGGIAGLNLCPDFLNDGGKAGIEDVLNHAEHFLALGGEKALCLGGDLDGIENLPEGMTGIESYDMIYEAMLQKNWNEDLVRDIFYYNLFEFLERVL
ncbi:MAG: membrane dipeptidase [Clostridiales bacterium]|nr:membrane dipeptidase [Clostridiales bacterium]